MPADRRIKVFEIGGLSVKIRKDSKIYMPSAASMITAKNLRELEGSEVLDLGTGSGFLAIIASKLGAKKVIATDISRRALKDAEENAALNNVDNIEFRLGSLYEPVNGEKFDVIISNPPMTPSPRQLPAYTWGGPDGRRVLEPVIAEAPSHLRERGRLIIPVVSLVGIGRVYRLLINAGLRPRVLDYATYRFGKTLLDLMDYIAGLPDADYVYDSFMRPCWRIVVFEASKS